MTNLDRFLASQPGLKVDLSADAKLAYGADWTRQWQPAPAAIVFPEDNDQVLGVVQAAMQWGVALVPSGGRTGLSGGAVAANGEVVVSMERMRRILAFNAEDRTFTVQAGVTTQQVQEVAAQHGLHYPVDFGSRGSSQIGGNVATNAGGIKVLRYGMTRDWVAGLKVVTGAGELLDLNRGLIKNNSGYDLRQLFIGSEGTLGLIVEITLRLTEPPPPQQVMLLAVREISAAIQALAHLRQRLHLSAYEFFTDGALPHLLSVGLRNPFESRYPHYVLAEFDADSDRAAEAFEQLMDQGLVFDGVLSESESQATSLWQLRERITESIARFRPYKNDIAVRISQLPGFLEKAHALLADQYPSCEVIWFGHLGDGNLHVSVLPPAAINYEDFLEVCGGVTSQLSSLLAEFGGTISAEHGIGLLKKPYLASSKSQAEIQLMRQIKDVFDPHRIMNPGKVF